MFGLSGIGSFNIVGGDLVYPEGYVAIEGEIYYVPAATVPFVGANWYYEVEESFDPAGYEVFQDGGAPQNTYAIRTVKVVTYAAAQATTATRKPIAALTNLDDKVKQLFLAGIISLPIRKIGRRKQLLYRWWQTRLI
jgi:hypothetical protein